MNNNSPLVTCIIPSKNRPQLVTRAVTSALNQTHKSMEVIVIDDSTDAKTQKALCESGTPIRYIKNEISKGAPYSRNVGLHEAKGEIVTFLDDDDVWMPNKIECQLKLIKNSPIVGCNYTTIINGKKYYVKSPETVTFKNMLYNNYLGSTSFVMLDRTVIKDCYFDETLEAGQDWDMWLSAMKAYNIEEAKIASEYMVDYNSGNHLRITNNSAEASVLMSIYNKHITEYDDFDSWMFGLCMLTPYNNSFILKAYRAIAKTKARGKGFRYFIKCLLMRISRRIEVY